ncbi:MAG: hypothetical protein HY962_09750 [Ignavibacteriae bacterium]|nr:hypothetical protein [Ignavibacteriota bacterium]
MLSSSILIVFFLLCACVMPPMRAIAQVPVQDSIAILAYDAAGQSGGIVIGYHPDATTGYDPLLGDKPIPPVPAVDAFDFRCIDPPGLRRTPPTGCYRDIRRPQPAAVADTFRIRVQPQNGAFPVRIGWRQTQLRAFRAAFLRLSNDTGDVSVDMHISERVEIAANARLDFLIILTR